MVGLVQRVHARFGVLRVDRFGVGRAERDHAAGLRSSCSVLHERERIGHVLEHILRDHAVVAAREHALVGEVLRVFVVAGARSKPAFFTIRQEQPAAAAEVEQLLCLARRRRLRGATSGCRTSPAASNRDVLEFVERIVGVVVREVDLVARVKAEAARATPDREFSCVNLRTLERTFATSTSAPAAPRRCCTACSRA